MCVRLVWPMWQLAYIQHLIWCCHRCGSLNSVMCSLFILVKLNSLDLMCFFFAENNFHTKIWSQAFERNSIGVVLIPSEYVLCIYVCVLYVFIFIHIKYIKPYYVDIVGEKKLNFIMPFCLLHKNVNFAWFDGARICICDSLLYGVYIVCVCMCLCVLIIPIKP